jgi:hypothetical protein
MRFRMGLMIGLGVGFYLGTAAGRERHEQINKMIRRVKRTDAYETATEKAHAAVDLAVERTKDLVTEHTPLGNAKQGDLVEAATNGVYDTRV